MCVWNVYKHEMYMYKVWGFRDEKLEKKITNCMTERVWGGGLLHGPLSRGKIDVDKFLNSGERPHK